MSAQQNQPDGTFELIVIGAGINGAAIAREAALSGVKTLVVERGDVGSGTSSASSRLIHGGLRYLEYGEFSLVYESLHERERLLQLAPHLVAPLELVIPVYRGAKRPKWQINVGLALYDLLSLGKSVPKRASLTREQLVARLPGIGTDELLGGASYYDAQVRFPERLVIENLRDAVAHGAVLRTYSRVTRIVVANGRAVGVEWQGHDGSRSAARAPLIVNAAGPWVDEVLGEIHHTQLLGGTKGSHIIVPRFASAPDVGVYVEARSDGRPLFILPWNDLVLIGTTDERYDGEPADATIEPRELDYLATEAERVFPSAAGLKARVLYTHTGVRPLPHQRRGKTAAITRRHLIRRHRAARGLYSVVGGKLTTHRALAEDVVRKLRREWPRPLGASPTLARPLPGALASSDRDELLAELAGRFGAAQAHRLWHVYGGAAAEVAARARDAELARTIDPSGVLWAELTYAIEREWAVTLEDLLQRRCMAGLGADFGLVAAAGAATALGRLGIWDAGKAEHELATYRELARRHHARG